MQVFLNFHYCQKFEKFFNVTFITLILKIVGTHELIDFCLISLICSIYQIISTMLANHISLVMGSIIFKPQSTFIRGWQILDLILIANECLDSCLRDDILEVLCKLDMEKIYDHVCLNFLFYMLKRCSFEDRWCNWIIHYVTTIIYFS